MTLPVFVSSYLDPDNYLPMARSTSFLAAMPIIPTDSAALEQPPSPQDPSPRTTVKLKPRACRATIQFKKYATENTTQKAT